MSKNQKTKGSKPNVIMDGKQVDDSFLEMFDVVKKKREEYFETKKKEKKGSKK